VYGVTVGTLEVFPEEDTDTLKIDADGDDELESETETVKEVDCVGRVVTELVEHVVGDIVPSSVTLIVDVVVAVELFEDLIERVDD